MLDNLALDQWIADGKNIDAMTTEIVKDIEKRVHQFEIEHHHDLSNAAQLKLASRVIPRINQLILVNKDVIEQLKDEHRVRRLQKLNEHLAHIKSDLVRGNFVGSTPAILVRLAKALDHEVHFEERLHKGAFVWRAHISPPQ